MALTPSTMLSLGTQASDFTLPDVTSGKSISLKNFSGKKAILVMFISVHCPYVKHIRQELSKLSRDYQNKDIAIIAVSSNNVEKYPDDSPENLKKMAKELNLTFPVCFDEDQKVAQEYMAACTPDFFLFDQNQKLVYRGQLDDSRPDSGKPVTGKDLRAAMDAVLSGKLVDSNQKPSMGCNIKWKQGNEPDYFKAH